MNQAPESPKSGPPADDRAPVTVPLPPHATSAPIKPWSPKEDLEEEVNAERWLLSYADFITLLMVLFMMLYALQLVKAKDAATADQRAQPVAAATAPPAEGQTEAPAEPPRLPPNPDRAIFVARIAPLAEQGNLRFAQDARGVELDISAGVLFNSGDARLLPQARKLLQPVAAALRAVPRQQVLVEGHTDSIPIATAKYESNWELSSARAGAVVRYFVDQGIEPYRLVAMGRADNVPAALGDDADSLARNRRVTILVRY